MNALSSAGEVDLAAVEVHVAAKVHLPCGRDPGSAEAAGYPLGAPRLLAVQLGAPSQPKDPEVPRVVHLSLGHDPGARVHPAARRGGDLGRRLEPRHAGEVEEPNPQRVGDPVQHLPLGVRGERPVAQLLLVVVELGADEVQLVLAPPGAGSLGGHDQVHVRVLPQPNPVDPGKLGAEVVRVAAPAPAVEEDARAAAVAVARWAAPGRRGRTTPPPGGRSGRPLRGERLPLPRWGVRSPGRFNGDAS